MNVRTINSGSYAEASSRTAVAAFDEESYLETWTSMIGGGEMPDVDFSKEAVVFLFAGTRNTGGYSIAVRGALIEEETLVVDAPVNGPPAGAIVTQVITSPYAVVSVDSRNFRDVRWNP